MQGGADPATEHMVASTAADDFATVAVQFLQRYAKPKNRGWKETARLIGLIPDPTNPSDDPATFVAHQDGAKKWGHRKVADITRADINRHLDGIVDRGSPIAANRVFAALRKMFGWAETRYALTANPCDRVERPSAEVSRDRVLSDDELKSVWVAAGELDWPFGTLIQLLALTGQRLNEVAGMAWSELDLEKKLWTLPRGRVKNDKGHEVPLSAQAIKVISSVPKVAGRDMLFTTTGKSPISGFSKTKVTIDEQSGVTDWTFHDLRRTLASGMARLGINLPVIEKVLNHSSGTSAALSAFINDIRSLTRSDTPSKPGARTSFGLLRVRPTTSWRCGADMALFDEALIIAACGDGDPGAIRALSDSIRVAMRDRPALGAAPVRAGGGLGDSDAAISPTACCEPASGLRSRPQVSWSICSKSSSSRIASRPAALTPLKQARCRSTLIKIRVPASIRLSAKPVFPRKRSGAGWKMGWCASNSLRTSCGSEVM